MLRGGPSPTRSIDAIAAWNQENVTGGADLDCAALAAQVQQAYDGFLQEARRRPAEQLAGWHAGLKLPVSTLCAILAGEAYIHGWDIARALRRPWRLDPENMRTIFLGLLPVLPHYLDRAARRRAHRDLRRPPARRPCRPRHLRVRPRPAHHPATGRAAGRLPHLRRPRRPPAGHLRALRSTGPGAARQDHRQRPQALARPAAATAVPPTLNANPHEPACGRDQAALDGLFG